jgi:antitoxin component of RelBE/YafQ-DinJ toxin-antitoxin module
MTTKVIFNADPKIKAKAMANAKKQGITISYYLNNALVAFAEGTKRVEVVEQVNDKTLKRLKKDYAEIKAGKDLSPTFTNAKDALSWLYSK